MLVEKEEELCIATRNVNALVRLSTISYGLFSLTTNKKKNPRWMPESIWWNRM